VRVAAVHRHVAVIAALAVGGVLAVSGGSGDAARSTQPQVKIPPRHWPKAPRRHRITSRAPRATPTLSVNVRGGLTDIGNTLVTCPNNAAARRRGGRPGTRAGEPCLGQNNNDLNMRYVNVDPGSGRFNSSSATLSIPSDARVLHAYLYWGADLAPGVNNPDGDAAPGGRNPNTNELWKRVRLRVDGGAYTPIDAEDPLRNGQWAGVASWYSSVGNWPGFAYQVRADVTNEVRAGVQTTRRRGRAGAKLTAITVANVQAGQGFNRHAGWTLFVAWESPTAPWRNLSLFDGFDFVQVQGGQQLVVGPLNFTGFRTPASGPVEAHVTTWAYEGDRGITGDYLALGTLGLPCASLPKRSDGANPIDNFFNGSISRGGSNVPDRVPAFVNQLGFDLDTLTATGVIGNNATGASACLGTVGDTYFFGGLAFDVLIRAPNVHIDKVADRTQANPGELVTYTGSVSNPQRPPHDPLYPTPTSPATNMVVTDVLPSGLDFVAFVSNPGGLCVYVAASRVISCAVGTLDVDESFVYRYQARVNGAAQGTTAAPLVNTTCYRSNSLDEPDSNFYGCDDATVLVPPEPPQPPPLVDLGVVKTVSPQIVAPGATLTWHIVATNHGPGTSTGFVLADQLPAEIGFVSASASPALTCTTPAVGSSGAVTCTAPSVPPKPTDGSTLELTITGTVSSSAPDGALLVNVSTVNGNEDEPVPDPHPNRDTALARVVVGPGPVPPDPTPEPPEPDGPPDPPIPTPTPPFVPPGQIGTKIVLHKRSLQTQASRGATVSFRLRVDNTGEAAANRVRICDRMSRDLVPIAAPGYTVRGNLICTTVRRIPIGGHVTLTVSARIAPSAKAGFAPDRATARGRNTRAVHARAVVVVRVSSKCPGRC